MAVLGQNGHHPPRPLAKSVAEASRFNAGLAAAGKASFHLTSADALPFTNDSFDRAFSTDVVHFWTEPLASLSECARASSGRRDGHGMPCQRMRRTLRRRSLASIRATPLSGNTLCHGFYSDARTSVRSAIGPSKR
ncbi:MAG: methyltransferase domain-containing protein [Bradyrhizobium sp.]|nr:methyltransferase domain-containing protein [Bradyrhizobium sp.]